MIVDKCNHCFICKLNCVGGGMGGGESSPTRDRAVKTFPEGGPDWSPGSPTPLLRVGLGEGVFSIQVALAILLTIITWV